MGATTFETIALGRTESEAFAAARREAQHWHGHGGYTGTIAEKTGFTRFVLPTRTTSKKMLDTIYQAEEFRHIAWERESLAEDIKRGWGTKTEHRKREAQIKKLERKRDSFWKRNEKLHCVVESLLPTYSDKWGDAVCFELHGKEAVDAKKRLGRSGTRDRVFLFCGWASC